MTGVSASRTIDRPFAGWKSFADIIQPSGFDRTS
jgi:hypothetical protein